MKNLKIPSKIFLLIDVKETLFVVTEIPYLSSKGVILC